MFLIIGCFIHSKNINFYRSRQILNRWTGKLFWMWKIKL